MCFLCRVYMTALLLPLPLIISLCLLFSCLFLFLLLLLLSLEKFIVAFTSKAPYHIYHIISDYIGYRVSDISLSRSQLPIHFTYITVFLLLFSVAND